MILRNLNLSCKSELFCLNGPIEAFKMTLPYFCIVEMISPLMRTRPLIWTNLNTRYSSMVCTKFDWNWPTGSWEEYFKRFLGNINTIIPHCSSARGSTTGDNDFNKIEFSLCQKAFPRKPELFWLNAAWEDFYDPTRFCIFVIISLRGGHQSHSQQILRLL
jgi:hypothetical protein